MTRTLSDGNTVEVNETLLRFGWHLAVLMDEGGVSRKALARDMGVHPNTVDNWINAKTDPGIVNLVALADRFNTTVDKFFE